MYLTRVEIHNLGPLREVVIEPGFTDGKPIPILIVGQNGAGKTLALGAILDAIVEIRRQTFRSLKEVEANQYIRVSSKDYITSGAQFSSVDIEFSSKDHKIVFTEATSHEPSTLANNEPSLYSKFQIGNPAFAKTGFLKNTFYPETAKTELEKATFLYYPYFRYERAPWLNDRADVGFIRTPHFFGDVPFNLVRSAIIDEIRGWILDILLDRELGERQTKDMYFPTVGETLTVLVGFDGPNTRSIKLVNELLTKMFQRKDGSVKSARVGISAKEKRSIAVLVLTDSGEQTVSPDLTMLSSGELSIFAMACDIIRSFELSKGAVADTLDEITGVVLVDEIDLHLHMKFSRDIAPYVIRLFPLVQFIMSAHSPYFVLGMHDTGVVDIRNFPSGAAIEAVNYEEFRHVYDDIIARNDQFQQRYNDLLAKSTQDLKPLIITEGKTDWKHLKEALRKLQSHGRFADLDVEFFEFEDEVSMGDSRLKTLAEASSMIKQGRKRIFIFDRDNKSIVKAMSGSPAHFKELGNGVFSLCIAVPHHRTQYENIVIELLYEETDLRTKQPATGRRLWFDNEIERVVRTSGNVTRTIATPIMETEYTKKVFDTDVDKLEDASGQKVGISKAAFAEMACDPHLGKNFDVGGFAATFEVISAIVRAVS